MVGQPPVPASLVLLWELKDLRVQLELENYQNLKFDNLQKSVNLQYNTLGCLDDGTNESSNKLLMFQVLFFFHDFLQNSLQKFFQFIFLFFFIKLQK